MTDFIPGMIEVEGREFLYVEVIEGEGFRKFVDDALDFCSKVPMPQSGGVLEEKAHITLEDGSRLLALSYKGDIAGWRRKLTDYSESKGRKWGIASNKRIMLSDGKEVDLYNCNITFEE